MEHTRAMESRFDGFVLLFNPFSLSLPFLLYRRRFLSYEYSMVFICLFVYAICSNGNGINLLVFESLHRNVCIRQIYYYVVWMVDMPEPTHIQCAIYLSSNYSNAVRIIQSQSTEDSGNVRISQLLTWKEMRAKQIFLKFLIRIQKRDMYQYQTIDFQCIK